MATLVEASVPVNLEFIALNATKPKYPPKIDPFRHSADTNSHNHHDRHPWGEKILPNTEEFDALYARANNLYMYQLWYTPALDPFMATKVLAIEQIGDDATAAFVDVIHKTLQIGLDAAVTSESGVRLKQLIQSTLDKAKVRQEDKIFVRLGATSAKDSWAVNVPTAKPPPLEPNPDAVIKRLLTSGRVVGRILSLSDSVWPEDPGEALIIEEWTNDIQLRREFRVFCYQGKVTAISQDIWWEDLGWRAQYSPGFVDAITKLWSQVQNLLPFDTCTMDVLVTPPVKETHEWKAALIEFNGFGGHLNTGSDLFHWVKDADILYGKREAITVRFVNSTDNPASTFVEHLEARPETLAEKEEEMPDWLALENKIRATYAQDEKEQKPLNMDEDVKLPLRGKWCSAY